MDIWYYYNIMTSCTSLVEFREQKDTKKDDGVWFKLLFFKWLSKEEGNYLKKKKIIWESEKGKSSHHAGSDYYQKKKGRSSFEFNIPTYFSQGKKNSTT